MLEENRQAVVKMSSERSFGLVFAAVFAIVAVYPWFTTGSIRIWAAGLAVVLAGAGLVQPRLLRPLNTLWFKFGQLVGRVMSPVIMGLIFFCVITPVGFPMRMKRSASKASLWIVRNDKTPMQSMRNQF